MSRWAGGKLIALSNESAQGVQNYATFRCVDRSLYVNADGERGSSPRRRNLVREGPKPEIASDHDQYLARCVSPLSAELRGILPHELAMSLSHGHLSLLDSCFAGMLYECSSMLEC